jgi:hypothetical protein
MKSVCTRIISEGSLATHKSSGGLDGLGSHLPGSKGLLPSLTLVGPIRRQRIRRPVRRFAWKRSVNGTDGRLLVTPPLLARTHLLAVTAQQETIKRAGLPP